MTSMFLAPKIIDLTCKSPANYRIRPRAAVRIDAVVLHQTSMSRGNVADAYVKTHAHYVVMQDGRILHLHPIESFIIASSAFNEDAISIEFVGNFPTDNGHYWQGEKFGKHTLSSQQINGGRDLLRYLVDNYGIAFVFAHRQGEAVNSRGNCPGPDVWFNIGQWAVNNLGLSDGGPGYKEGKGSPIPDSWRQARA